MYYDICVILLCSQREEASSREAARKRDEALQRERERERLRQDKVRTEGSLLYEITQQAVLRVGQIE